MRILVTGSSGFLGYHVVTELIRNNHDVSVIVRDKAALLFDQNKVKIIEGNFAQESIFYRAAQNIDAVIHIAAITATNLLQYSDYEHINVDANRMIISVCKTIRIKALIFVSTSNTIGNGRAGFTSDEFNEISFPFTKSLYAQSKLNAESLYFEASKVLPHVIVLNPSFMIGSHDIKPSSGKLILMGWKKKVLFLPKGGKNFVSVTNVAKAVVSALTLGTNGERYLLTGNALSFKEFFTLLKTKGNYNQQIILLPDILLKYLAKIGDFIRFFGLKTDISTANINQLLIKEYYTNAKAKKYLNFEDTDIALAIESSINWFSCVKKIK